jgi:hypothetical protein
MERFSGLQRVVLSNDCHGALTANVCHALFSAQWRGPTNVL